MDCNLQPSWAFHVKSLFNRISNKTLTEPSFMRKDNFYRELLRPRKMTFSQVLRVHWPSFSGAGGGINISSWPLCS